ncbi:MAG TPA: response regulator [Verrucomicrobiae bacterium]|nr:response regulator [Verrucomicrobiae bacterium]
MSKTILLVEDDELIRQSLARVLTTKGLKVIQATNGKEGLESAANADLVVTDVRMPEMDGLQMVDALRKDPKTKELPIIILSNDEEASTLNKALEAGVTVYLSKSNQDADSLADQILAAAG